MLKKLSLQKLSWFIIGILSLYASLMGVTKPAVYSKVVTPQWLPGTISQDIITVFVSFLLLFLTITVKPKHVRLHIVVLSILFYLFYAYGIFVIERLYNSLYLIYMAILGISFWSIVYAFISLNYDLLKKINIPDTIRIISIVFSFLIILLFFTLWTSQLLILMDARKKIEFGYSIYILDLIFVLPALAISGELATKKRGLGIILQPILFIKAFTLLFSVGFGGVLKPLYKQPVNSIETTFYIGLSVIFFMLAVIYLIKLKVSPEKTTPTPAVAYHASLMPK